MLGTAFLLSIVHYVDNTLRFDDYTPDPGLITRPAIPLAWVVFTAFGVWGYLQYRRGDDRKAAIGLAVYSFSGLIGPLHYTEVSPSDFDWFQNLFVVLDTLAGVAVLGVACAWPCVPRRGAWSGERAFSRCWAVALSVGSSSRPRSLSRRESTRAIFSDPVAPSLVPPRPMARRR